MRALLPALALAPLIACHSPSEESTATADVWIPLFNGEDLSGWTPKISGFPAGENALDTFRVEDGLLTVDYGEYDSFDGRFGHLFHELELSSYRLRIEYRFVGEQVPGGPGWAFKNSGVMIHGQRPETMGLDQDFPVSIEVQFLGGGGEGDRPTGNLCTPGTHVVMDGELTTAHCISSTSPTFHGEEWVTVEVVVLGDQSVKHLVNGEPVLEYQGPQYDPGDPTAAPLIEDGVLALGAGTISLQSESHPIQFRRVEVLPLGE